MSQSLDPPPALKQADTNLYKCASRSSQLRAIKPIMAYWCDYWVVNQILAQQLHQTDPEILTFTMALMDKLERAKVDLANEEAVTDDAAGKAYVQQFAQDTLDRAQRVVTANRVTAQTANTFDASATFFNLLNVWGPVDDETRTKIKYAKWNAVRIFRAIKEGVDPNESNPRPEAPEPEPAQPATDSADQDAQPPASPSSAPRPVSVEDAADSEDQRDPATVSLPETPATAPSAIASDGLSLPDAPSSLPSAPQFHPSQPPEQQPSYFDTSASAPAMPSPMSPPLAPSAPSDLPQAFTPSPPPSVNAPFAPPSPPPPATQDAHPTTGPPTFAPSPTTMPAVAPPPVSPPPSSYVDMTLNPTLARPTIQPPSSASSVSSPVAPQPQLRRQNPPPPVVAAVPAVPAPLASGGVVIDDVAMTEAQKHARWAISALNFEDVPTAIKELRNALATLGAT